MFLSVWFYKHDSNDTKIIRFFVVHGLGLCMKLNGFVSHTFYAWSCSNNTEVPIYVKHNEYYLYLHTNTTMFAWGGVNSNKNIT